MVIRWAIRKALQGNYKIADSIAPDLLSTRESECLFLLIRGNTSKQIAKHLGLTYRTVEFYITNIKNKLACHTRNQLIEKSIEMGFYYNIPRSLMAS